MGSRARKNRECLDLIMANSEKMDTLRGAGELGKDGKKLGDDPIVETYHVSSP